MMELMGLPREERLLLRAFEVVLYRPERNAYARQEPEQEG